MDNNRLYLLLYHSMTYYHTDEKLVIEKEGCKHDRVETANQLEEP